MITRENYEEYFLLYVDNELSAQARVGVEQFVRENPDLREEWESLLQCRVLPDDDHVFADKDRLFFSGERAFQDVKLPDMDGPEHKEELEKQDWQLPMGAVDETNYADYLLHYIDGELDEETSKSVIDFGNQHPSRLQELMLLQKTVNTPDLSIVFPDKASLYRKDRVKVLALPWIRVAAAVIIIAIGAYLFYIWRGHTGAELANSGAGGHHPNQPANMIAPGQSASGQTAGTAQAAETAVDNSQLAKNDSPLVTPNTATALHIQKKGQSETGAARERSNPRVPDKETKSLAVTGNPATGDKPEKVNAGKDQLAVAVTPDNVVAIKSAELASHRQDIPGVSQNRPPVTAVMTSDLVKSDEISKANSSFATQALLSSTSSDNEEDLITQPSSAKKNKLRGIFRRVSRVLDKTASRDETEDKHGILVGSFQFALK